MPLALLMRAPITDGAAAVVVASEDWCRRSRSTGVKVRACSIASGAGGTADVGQAARRASDEAGVGPEDVDVVELHDAASPAELVTLEQLGIAAPGMALAMFEAGDTMLGGRCRSARVAAS